MFGSKKKATEATPLAPAAATAYSAAPSEDAMYKASWYIEDAMRGMPPTVRTTVTSAQRAAYLTHERLQRWGAIPLIVLALLTFFERPLWCLSGLSKKSTLAADSYWKYYPSDQVCPAPDGGQIYLSGLPYLPIGWGVLIELLCYALLLLVASYEMKFRGRDFWQLVRRARPRAHGHAAR